MESLASGSALQIPLHLPQSVADDRQGHFHSLYHKDTLACYGMERDVLLLAQHVHTSHGCCFELFSES